MTVIRTKTPAGEPIVIMSEAEFERLRELAEDAEDVATASRVQAKLAAGWEELLTSEEVDALLAAPSPLSFWREKRKITLETLAERVGVDLEALAAIEQGESLGDVHLYRRLAEELRVDIEDLVPNPA
ncbi:MAG TPA: helix-turn-helix transcriptional regulator [Beijerinckiaceae bacterium]|jgi:DNA-binding XRE family transcriptional regulator